MVCKVSDLKLLVEPFVKGGHERLVFTARGDSVYVGLKEAWKKGTSEPDASLLQISLSVKDLNEESLQRVCDQLNAKESTS